MNIQSIKLLQLSLRLRRFGIQLALACLALGLPRIGHSSAGIWSSDLQIYYIRKRSRLVISACYNTRRTSTRNIGALSSRQSNQFLKPLPLRLDFWFNMLGCEWRDNLYTLCHTVSDVPLSFNSGQPAAAGLLCHAAFTLKLNVCVCVCEMSLTKVLHRFWHLHSCPNGFAHSNVRLWFALSLRLL